MHKLTISSPLFLVLFACGACPGNGGETIEPHPKLCEPDEIRAEEARLWTSLLSAMKGVEEDCIRAAVPLNGWLDGHAQAMQEVTEELDRCKPASKPENQRLFMQAMLVVDMGCGPGTPMSEAKQRLERVSGVSRVPVPE